MAAPQRTQRDRSDPELMHALGRIADRAAKIARGRTPRQTGKLERRMKVGRAAARAGRGASRAFAAQKNIRLLEGAALAKMLPR